MRSGEHVVITGGAGYIGSLKCSELLAFFNHPNLHFVKADLACCINVDATQRSYSRSFLHVDGALVRGQVYNLGSEGGNYTKDEIVNLIMERLSGVIVHYKDYSFGGEHRDLIVSFAKIQQQLGFETLKTANEGVDELLTALRTRLIRNPYDRRYRNADTFVQ